MSAAVCCVEAGHSGTLILFLVDGKNQIDHAARLSLCIQRLRYEVARPSKAAEPEGLHNGERLGSFVVDFTPFGSEMGPVKPKEKMNAAVSAHTLYNGEGVLRLMV